MMIRVVVLHALPGQCAVTETMGQQRRLGQWLSRCCGYRHMHQLSTDYNCHVIGHVPIIAIDRHLPDCNDPRPDEVYMLTAHTRTIPICRVT